MEVEDKLEDTLEMVEKMYLNKPKTEPQAVIIVTEDTFHFGGGKDDLPTINMWAGWLTGVTQDSKGVIRFVVDVRVGSRKTLDLSLNKKTIRMMQVQAHGFPNKPKAWRDEK
jgi:hypothetical protein